MPKHIRGIASEPVEKQRCGESSAKDLRITVIHTGPYQKTVVPYLVQIVRTTLLKE